MPSVPDDFREFLKLLNSHGVEYLVVGGYAVGFHGYPRATVDMDIWVSTTPENAGRLVAAIREFGFADSGLAADTFTKPDRVVRMGVPPLRLEIITSASGVDFDTCFAARVRARIDDVDVNVISLDHLKTNKRAAGRHRDLNDLENLP
jgi:hypothetical protein